MAIINLNMNSVKSTASEVLDTLDEFFATELVAIEHGDEGDERETSITLGGAIMVASGVAIAAGLVAKFG